MNYGLVVAALRAELARLRPHAERLGLSESEAWNVLVVVLLRHLLTTLARVRGRDVEFLSGGRLFGGVPGFQSDDRADFRDALATEIQAPELPDVAEALPQLPIEALGQLYESLLAARPSDAERNLRKRTGSYYTPESLTQVVVERAFAALERPRGSAPGRLRMLDPALGAGAFLVQAGREAARRSGRSPAAVVEHELFGADISPLAVAVAEASLWLLADSPSLTLAAAGTHLREGDSLCAPAAARRLGRRGVDFGELSPEGFDIVLGNTP